MHLRLDVSVSTQALRYKWCTNEQPGAYVPHHKSVPCHTALGQLAGTGTT